MQTVVRLGNTVKEFFISNGSSVFEWFQFKISEGSYLVFLYTVLMCIFCRVWMDDIPVCYNIYVQHTLTFFLAYQQLLWMINRDSPLAVVGDEEPRKNPKAPTVTLTLTLILTLAGNNQGGFLQGGIPTPPLASRLHLQVWQIYAWNYSVFYG